MPNDPTELHKLFEEIDKYDTKPRDEYLRAPFGWPGGKSESLQQILPKLPIRKTWVEGCGGAGWVSLNRPKCDLEVFNDRHAGIVAFYRCLRDENKMRSLLTRLDLCLHAREEFIWAKATWENCTDDVERAARWYYMLRMSFGQLGRNFARATSGRSQQGRAFHNALELFPLIHSRLRHFQIENQDVLDCIRDYDSSETVFYIDPDYIGADTGIYLHRVEHRGLLDTIKESRGFFAVSGYANELYDSYSMWDERYTWSVSVTLQAQAFTENNNLANKRSVMDRSQKAEEVLWIKEAK